MPDLTTLIAFTAASLLVLLLPGPGVLFAVACSLGQGSRAGLVSAAGLAAGAFGHVIAASLGLSAVLLTSATAFGVVKALGAAYLIYLGIATLLDRRPLAGPRAAPPRRLARLFADGAVVSLFNPKIALFFLAYLPQFVDPARGPVARQVLLLGSLYCALAFLTDGGYALLAGRLRRWLGGGLLQGPLPRTVTGGLYIGLGLHAAFAERR